MTVAELMAKLKALPGDTPVCLIEPDGSECEIDAVYTADGWAYIEVGPEVDDEDDDEIEVDDDDDDEV